MFPSLACRCRYCSTWTDHLSLTNIWMFLKIPRRKGQLFGLCFNFAPRNCCNLGSKFSVKTLAFQVNGFSKGAVAEGPFACSSCLSPFPVRDFQGLICSWWKLAVLIPSPAPHPLLLSQAGVKGQFLFWLYIVFWVSIQVCQTLHHGIWTKFFCVQGKLGPLIMSSAKSSAVTREH